MSEPSYPKVSPETKVLFGDRIRHLRRARQMTQEALAQRARVTRQQINGVEQGKHLPSLQLAAKIARILGTTLESLGEGLKF